MNKFRRSLALLKCSFQVIGANRTLLLFPILITLLLGVIALFFIAPIALWPTGHAWTDPVHWQAIEHRWIVPGDAGHGSLTPAGYALMAPLYLISTFLATFFNAAFFSQILNALQGRPVSIMDGLRRARARLTAILAWSLFAGVVGLIIRTVEERVGLLGRWIVGLIGLAWSVASVFVIPILVMEPEGANPVRLIRSSAAMLKKTWGESLLGYLGIQFGGLLALSASLGLFGISFSLSIVFNNYWILGIASALWLLCMTAFIYLLNVASRVYMGALYVYASQGVVPAPFAQDQMNTAWKLKAGGKSAQARG